jgi:hypothetical protein
VIGSFGCAEIFIGANLVMELPNSMNVNDFVKYGLYCFCLSPLLGYFLCSD